MNLKDKVIVVTGGANGIGRALCRRFATEGPRGIVVADLEGEPSKEVARDVGGMAVTTDVADESQVVDLVRQTTDTYGPIDLFCSNAGTSVGGGIEVDKEEWDRIFGVNFWAHLWAARAVLPAMIERGEGYLLTTVSAAGLLTQIGSAPYAVTKHAALSLAEWIRVTHGGQGIRVSCLCPQGVRTRMLLGDDMDSQESFLYQGSLSPEEVAECVVQGLADERFLILPHAEVEEYFRRKGSDYDRWIRGMQRLQDRIREGYQV